MHRIRLGNTVFEGRNNAYVFEGEPTVMIDTGIAEPAVESDLAAGLGEVGLSFADVDEILLTHWHYDHSGLAGTIQEAGGATVRVHEADADLVADDPDAVRENDALRERRFGEWGIPPEERAELAAYLSDSTAGTGPTVTPFADGDRFAFGGREFEVLHLPGHAAGLSAFVADGEAFVGDAVLPKYTPNVGGADLRVERPLATYVRSLLRVVDRGFDRLWPGHRDPIDDPAGRARTILRHHLDRTANVVGALREHGPCDAWTVSAALFGDLEGIHILHGPGEAAAHLEHLVDGGVAERDGDEYALVEEDPDVGALFPEVPAELRDAQ